MNDKEMPDLTNYSILERFIKNKIYFILDENNNVIPANLLEWGNFFEQDKESRKRRIVKQEEVNGYRISTVFIGMNHNLLGRKLHIFETMVFKGDSGIEDYVDRYSTWDEAVEGHKKAVEWVKNGCKEDENNFEE